MSQLILKLNRIFGSLPTSEYELLDEGKYIGVLQIRHKPSHAKEIPVNMASHIYYEIIQNYRNKGYGKEILRLGLGEARKIGLKEIFITCLEDNTASRKIIEANGGIFIEEQVIPDLQKKLLKYVIKL